MPRFHFVKSRLEKTEVCGSGVDFRLCTASAFKKCTLSLVQQPCVLVGSIAISSEYLVYGIDLSMITELVMCRLSVLTQY